MVVGVPTGIITSPQPSRKGWPFPLVADLLLCFASTDPIGLSFSAARLLNA
jgi:hypothetical protein